MANVGSWSDEPLESVDEDSFGREPFAKLLAQTIDRVQLGEASTVFGLVGSWGSGKSSVAVMVAELLKSTWIVQPFTPWAASGTAALQLEFVAALDTALGGGLAEDGAVKTALRKYAKWASPFLGALPGFGTSLSDAAQVAVDEFTSRRPWSVEFAALSELVEKKGVRVLILCDDIDRLDAVELLEFLKVVRLLGRFPNVHYLVAYDADTVEDLLAAEGIGGRTSSFMEKIVQHPFELPQIDVATRWRHISSAVMGSLDEQSVQLDETMMSRYRRLIDTLAVGLVTPRQIARYENHLNVLSTLVPGEVDPLDFAALANLRLNHHEIYEKVPGWAGELNAGLASADNRNGLTEENWIARLNETSRRANITGAWESIGFLFPGVSTSRRDVLHPQAFSDARYIERYYSLGVPENDVSDVIVSQAISSLLGREPNDEAESAILEMLTAAQPSVARLVFAKLNEYRRGLLNENDRVSKLVKFLYSEYRRVEPSQNDPDSSLDVILDWLSDEVFRGYSAGEFTRVGLFEYFGEELSLGMLLQVRASTRSGRDERAEAMFADFADYFLKAFRRGGRDALEPLRYLRLKLSLVLRAKGEHVLRGLLDQIVDGDVAAFESVAIAMVRTENWFGGETVRQNLNFETEEWEAAVSVTVRERMAAKLTGEFDFEPIDTDVVSDSNRRRLAIVMARRDFVPYVGAALD